MSIYFFNDLTTSSIALKVFECYDRNNFGNVAITFLNPDGTFAGQNLQSGATDDARKESYAKARTVAHFGKATSMITDPQI